MNYAQKYDIFFPFFIKVVVNKKSGVFFSDNWYDAVTKNITFSYNAAIPFFHYKAGHLST